MITTEKAVLCSLEDTTPLAFLNIYEVGDVWVKIRGCEDCSWEDMQKCCGKCPMLEKAGCTRQLGGRKNKPFKCVVIPAPDVCHSWCQQEFKSISGSHKGKTRKISEPGNVFH